MKFSLILCVVTACVTVTQAQDKSTLVNETQEQQQELQQQISLSASASEDSSFSGSGLSLFDSMSGSRTTSSSASNDASNGDSISASTSEESAASDESETSTSASSPGDLVPSGSGEVDQSSLSGSQDATSSSGSVSVGDSSSASGGSSTGSQDATSSSGSVSVGDSSSASGGSSTGSLGTPAPTEAPGPSISVEDSVQLSESFGGPHGTEFSDESIATSGQTVASVTIRAGKRVDGIALEITGPVATTFSHGGGGGDPKTLTLGAGEYITSMEAHWGERKGRTRIFYLRFTTSAGNSIEGGSTTDSKNTVTAPEGFQLGGFFGRAGDEIDLLGAIWTSIEVVTPAPGAPTPAPTPWAEKKIGHDEVVPFKQPEPVTIAEKAAVKFKPQLHISNGCHAYPAVNIGGQTSGGLKTSGAPSAGCKGSGWGSQVYGRSTWHNGVWAIMYSWYFPKDSPSTGLGHRHDWEHVIVWIDNPGIAEPKILAVTPSAHSGYSAQVPPDADKVEGTSVKVNYESKWPINHALGSTTKGGDYQDLIMWEQLTDAARLALENQNFGKANVPMKDGNFVGKLNKAWPFD